MPQYSRNIMSFERSSIPATSLSKRKYFPLLVHSKPHCLPTKLINPQGCSPQFQNKCTSSSAPVAKLHLRYKPHCSLINAYL